MWRNWYTHWIQNPAGNHVGSSPTISTKEETSIEDTGFLFGLSVVWTRKGRLNQLSCGQLIRPRVEEPPSAPKTLYKMRTFIFTNVPI